MTGSATLFPILGVTGCLSALILGRAPLGVLRQLGVGIAR